MTTPQYTFLPWYRTGLATAIDRNPGVGEERGEIKVRLKTLADRDESLSVEQTVRLIGPGDVLGIDARAVVRLEPHPNANDFEPNYMAAIEFFDEDYAWRYSPRAPGGAGRARLLPWLALLVLEEGEYDIVAQPTPGLPRVCKVHDAAVLPAPDDLWAWAHAHLNVAAADTADPKTTAAQLAANPADGCSRLVAARRLRANKSYRAVLVPAFEAGRQAGLQASAAQPGPMAWGRAGAVDLPVYFEWSFRTGQEGDFESLARRLEPVTPDPTVGRRPMNLSRPLPGAVVPPVRNAAAVPRAVLDLEGALQLPQAQPSGWAADSRLAFQTWLAEFINLGELWTVNASHQLSNAAALPGGTRLPIVLPPAYGRWHANLQTLEPAQAGAADGRWFEQIDLDPRNRVAAAFGTLVVQKNQEAFMARAWAQYGELFSANRFRYRAQFMREVLTATQDKHLAPLADAALLATTGLAHARVLVSGDAAEKLTVHGSIQRSALPLAAVQPALRRLLRRNGPLAKRSGAGVSQLAHLIEDLASQRQALAPAWAQPQERLSLSHSPAAVARPEAPPPPESWLGSDWDELRPRLVAYLEHTLQLLPRQPQLQATVRLLQDMLRTGDAQAVASAARLTPQAVADVRGATGWVPPALSQTAQPVDRLPVREHRSFSSAAWNFRQAAMNAAEWLTQEVPVQTPRPALDLVATAGTLREQLSPYRTVAERVDRMFALPAAVKVASYDPLEAIMAHPQFDDAAYEYLKKISEEYVVPNLGKIPNNGITLLEANWRFIESFMVGLNHEMARELLWRGYRTDQRGTCFAQFWRIAGVPGASKGDIEPIHGWKRGGRLTPLGENRPAGRIIKNNLVLVIRGDLLRRYPNTQVCAVKAVPNPAPRKDDSFQFSTRRPGTLVQQPTLLATFAPDVYCFGFDLDKTEARGAPPAQGANPGSDLGWYFVLAERFGEPRFGLDDPGTETPAFPQTATTLAAGLTWAHLVKDQDGYAAMDGLDLSLHQPAAADQPLIIDKKTVDHPEHRATWGTDAADMAAILLQTPFRMYFHAGDMLLP